MKEDKKILFAGSFMVVKVSKKATTTSFLQNIQQPLQEEEQFKYRGEMCHHYNMDGNRPSPLALLSSIVETMAPKSNSRG